MSQPSGQGSRNLESVSAARVGGAPAPMSPGEKLDPLPDAFILQPPVFHPVSSCSGLEPPRTQGVSLPGGARLPGAGMERPSVWGPASPVAAPGAGKDLLSLAKWLTSPPLSPELHQLSSLQTKPGAWEAGGTEVLSPAELQVLWPSECPAPPQAPEEWGEAGYNPSVLFRLHAPTWRGVAVGSCSF